MRMRRQASSVVPLHSDKFYVYALFKPHEFNPFYVGKGIRNRINDHFKKCNLRHNSPKTGIIKKYGNSIRREILCYFDTESEAYNFEEYLISTYRLVEDGGCLVNYAKTRFQYSERFKTDVCAKGHLARKVKYEKEIVFTAYDLHFRQNLRVWEIAEETGIPENYLYYLLQGRKQKTFFKEYITSEDFFDGRNGEKSQSVRESKLKVPSDTLINLFDAVCRQTITLGEAAKTLGCNEVWLGKVFLGKKRKDLQLDYERYQGISKGRAVLRVKNQKTFNEAYTTTGCIRETMKLTGFSKTSCYRFLKRLESGMPAGTGDASGGSGDGSISNNENT